MYSSCYGSKDCVKRRFITCKLRLVIGWQNDRPIHVCAAINHDTNETIIITAYEPSLDEWQEGFVLRRKK